MEAQRGQATCLRSHSRKCLSLGTNPCLSGPPGSSLLLPCWFLQAHLLNINHMYVPQQVERFKLAEFLGNAFFYSEIMYAWSLVFY